MALKKVDYKKFIGVLVIVGFLAGMTWWVMQETPDAKPLHEPIMQVEESDDIDLPEESVVIAQVRDKKVEEAKSLHQEEAIPVSRAMTNQFVVPTKGVITSAFESRWGRNHDGIDIANDLGTPIQAARDGKVSFVGWLSGYGNTIMIEHKQGYTTLYGHLQAILVDQGSFVKAGQIIAKMGSTGNSTGPHLHFEVERDGVLMDPAVIFNN